MKKHPALPVVAMDVLILPAWFLCSWLTGVMLAGGKPCSWALVGARCATCGGTHCVQSFLQGNLVDAFSQNPMVFCWILYGIATVLLLNFCFLLKQRWAGTALKVMYSAGAFFVHLGVYLLFTLLRNIPFLLNLFS